MKHTERERERDERNEFLWRACRNTYRELTISTAWLVYQEFEEQQEVSVISFHFRIFNPEVPTPSNAE